MHLQNIISLLALPLLATAQEGPFDQYVAQFQNVLGNIGARIPNPSRHDPIGAAQAKAGELNMHILTLENFKQTLYAPVSGPGAKKYEEWWILVTGANKTCFGRCGEMDKAFNQTAAKLALLPQAPSVGYINCDDQPVLCNAYSMPAASIWVVEMVPRPAPVDIYTKRINLTAVDSSTFMDLYKNKGERAVFEKKEGYYHPFDGMLNQYNAAVPLGYFLWFMSVVPSWAMMLIVSFASRTMMSRRMAPEAGRPGAVPVGTAGAARPRGAAPGDATL